MKSKKAELVSENIVRAILFALILIATMVVLAMWWNSYRSQGLYPATRSINAIVKNSYLLDVDNPEFTRRIPIQTGEYYIISFNENPELCTDKREETHNCLCVCKNQECKEAYEKPGKYCRNVPYLTSISLGPEEDILNYVLEVKDGALHLSLTNSK